MRSEPPDCEQHIGGDWAKRITHIYVIASAFQSWPFPVCSQAAHYGCGCWAENACNMNRYSTAVSTSGIPRTLSNLLYRCVFFSATLHPLLPVFFLSQSETGTRCEPPHPSFRFRFRFDEGSFKKPENSFWWATVPAKWFSSFISSAYWLMGLRALLVSCVPGALKSPLDLQRHLTWDTCCRYDGRSMSLSAVRGW